MKDIYPLKMLVNLVSNDDLDQDLREEFANLIDKLWINNFPTQGDSAMKTKIWDDIPGYHLDQGTQIKDKMSHINEKAVTTFRELSENIKSYLGQTKEVLTNGNPEISTKSVNPGF